MLQVTNPLAMPNGQPLAVCLVFGNLTQLSDKLLPTGEAILIAVFGPYHRSDYDSLHPIALMISNCLM